MNLFGFGIDTLNAETFVAAMRVTFVTLALIGAAMAGRDAEGKRAGRIVFFVAISGFTLTWLATMFPLPNVYGTNGSQDRENHLGWANVVALGFSPLRTFQVNHLHFEPVWPLLTAFATGFNVDRVQLVFQCAPLVLGLLLAFSIRFAWIRGHDGSNAARTEAAFAALGALLLIGVPGDSDGIFRNPWALTFLLKPNHVLGLVFIPLAALAIARAKDWKTRLFAGFVLQLVGWAFVIHMVLFVAGLLAFVVVSWLTKREDRRRDLLDAGTAVGANLLIVSPYLFILVTAYPFLHGSSEYGLSFFSERPFEGPLRLGLLALLSGWGAWNTYHRGGRIGRLFASQWLTAQIIWQAFPLLGLLGQAREQDEAFYWCRFWTGLFAGIGVFHAVSTVGSRFRWHSGGAASARPALGSSTALSLLFLIPSLLPTWWNPSTMDQYFVAARKPLPAWIDEPNRFIRANTPIEAVFTGDRNYARWIAAYGQRRVLLANSMNLPNDYPERLALEDGLLHDGPAAAIKKGVERYGVRYLLATSTPLERDRSVTVAQMRSYQSLEVVYEKTFPNTTVTIFKVRVGDRTQ